MTLSPQLVRQRIAADLEAISGWSEFTGLPSRFPEFAARPIAHKHFAVDMPSVAIEEGPQKVIGMPLWEDIVVRWSYLIRPADGRDDFDLALIEEQKLVAALRATVGNNGPSCKITGISRTSLADGTYLLGTITATAWHHYPLT